MADDNKTAPPAPAQEQQERGLFIKQMYLKSIDFDVQTPVHEIQAEWKPDAKLDLDVQSSGFENDNYAIELTLNISVMIDKTNIFTLKLVHGGLFQIAGYNENDMARLLNSICPNMIFPFARQVVSNSTNQAGFPPLNLAPIDFEARYQGILQQSKEKKS